MSGQPWLPSILVFALATLAAVPVFAEDSASLDAPEAVLAGSRVTVQWRGPNGRFDKVGIVPVGNPDSADPKRFAEFTSNGNRLQVLTPEQPGEYELRYLSFKPAATLARKKLVTLPVSATLEGPGTAVGGATISVRWTGPNNQYDKIGVVPVGAPEKTNPTGFDSFVSSGNPTRVRIPEPAGEYEIRYLTGQSSATLATTKLTISGATASLEGPGTAVGGAVIPVKWQGPNNQYDRITVVKAGAPEHEVPSSFSSFVSSGNPTRVRIPEQPGEYEVRYVSGAKNTTLAAAKLTISGASASIEGPVTAAAGSMFEVIWQGPGNLYDRIAILEKAAPDGRWKTLGFVHKGEPLPLRAPLNVGEYELRYLTGSSNTSLARADLHVTPGRQEPGTLRVTTGQKSVSGGGAVEIILDASGSMLQRIGKQRKIDIAVGTLTKLTSATIPAGTSFALRVLGRETDSCQTDLALPLQPLNAATVASTAASLTPKNNAKTPIGAALLAVAEDLRSVQGERLVILVTDGEETCGGNPPAAIETLKQTGVGVRINIVGFAIDDGNLASTFRVWAEAGRGAYFEARDAAGLHDALSKALRPAFEVIDANRQVVATGFAGGEPLRIMPGQYSVRLTGSASSAHSVVVRPKDTTALQL